VFGQYGGLGDDTKLISLTLKYLLTIRYRGFSKCTMNKRILFILMVGQRPRFRFLFFFIDMIFSVSCKPFILKEEHLYNCYKSHILAVIGSINMI